mmetsp:Transcript_74324/g.160708  ORF Transcript_74324/g.160708 Transcript_74324/m.160708 type:complete len:226 (-) Transcript_74324:354-1031(-)
MRETFIKRNKSSFKYRKVENNKQEQIMLKGSGSNKGNEKEKVNMKGKEFELPVLKLNKVLDKKKDNMKSRDGHMLSINKLVQSNLVHNKNKNSLTNRMGKGFASVDSIKRNTYNFNTNKEHQMLLDKEQSIKNIYNNNRIEKIEIQNPNNQNSPKFIDNNQKLYKFVDQDIDLHSNKEEVKNPLTFKSFKSFASGEEASMTLNDNSRKQNRTHLVNDLSDDSNNV